MSSKIWFLFFFLTITVAKKCKNKNLEQLLFIHQPAVFWFYIHPYRRAKIREQTVIPEPKQISGLILWQTKKYRIS